MRAIVFFSVYVKSKDMCEVTKTDVESYEACIRNEYISHEGYKLSNRIIIYKLRCLKTYFRFLREQGRIASDLASGLKVPEKGEFYRGCLPSKADIEEVVARPDPYTHSGIRDRALLRMMYICPITSDEYRNLNIEDVEIRGSFLHVKTSNGRYKGKVPLDDETRKALEKYIRVSRPALWNRRKTPTNKLFLNYYGEQFDTCTLIDIFAKYRGNKMINATSFRQSRAMHMIQDGADPKEIQKLFGFKHIHSATVYEVLVTKGLKSVYRNGPNNNIRFGRQPAQSEPALKTA